jgi:hypothetical protein
VISSTHSELARDVTEHSFSRAWTTILAERRDAPNGGYLRCLWNDHVTERDTVSGRVPAAFFGRQAARCNLRQADQPGWPLSSSVRLPA